MKTQTVESAVGLQWDPGKPKGKQKKEEKEDVRPRKTARNPAFGSINWIEPPGMVNGPCSGRPNQYGVASTLQ